jgi:hypothetical protein
MSGFLLDIDESHERIRTGPRGHFIMSDSCHLFAPFNKRYRARSAQVPALFDVAFDEFPRKHTQVCVRSVVNPTPQFAFRRFEPSLFHRFDTSQLGC